MPCSLLVHRPLSFQAHQRQLGLREHREQEGTLATEQSTPTRNVKRPCEAHPCMNSCVRLPLRHLGEAASCRLAAFLPQTPEEGETFGAGFCLLALTGAVSLGPGVREPPSQEPPTDLCSAVDAWPNTVGPRCFHDTHMPAHRMRRWKRCRQKGPNPGLSHQVLPWAHLVVTL